ncbi:MAG: VWA domain-containing protein [Proteobacteria bacterium]|nr:VWA domain-containing protein [Pseudomonadota bacterium]
MHLANPIGLLVLGLIPILVFIHSLKPKARHVEVTTLFLWREILREERGGLRLSRLVKNLALLLQIAIVCLSALALSKPVWFSESWKKGNRILVLDTSASMKTRTASGVRFDRAKEKALELIDELPDKHKMLILESGSSPRLAADFTDDKQKLAETVRNTRPTEVAGNLEKALYLALSFLDAEGDDWIIVVTDGAGGEFQRLSGIHPRIKPVMITGGKRNVGITRFYFRQELKSVDRFEVMLEVKNFNDVPVLCPIHLGIGDNTLLEKTIGLDAREKRLLIFPYYGAIVGTAVARLEIEDDFPVDDTAYSVLDSSKETWIQLVTKGNYYLEKLLEAYPNFMVNTVDEIIPGSWETQVRQNDIVILDRIAPPSLKEGNLLLIDSFSPSGPLVKTGDVPNPKVLDWKRKHPIMSNLDLNGLNIESASRIAAEQGLRPLVESHRTGLVYSYQKEGLRAVFLGFDILRSDLPLRVAFPVMMSNIFQWLKPNRLHFTSSQTKAGTAFPITQGTGAEEMVVRAPSGRQDTIQSRSNPFPYENTVEVGIYKIIEGNKRRTFAVNLVDESESDIKTPVLDPLPGTYSLPVSSEKDKTEVRLWIFLFLCATVILLLEGLTIFDFSFLKT